jgi:hypothetical protein
MPDPKEKKSSFNNIDYKSIANNIVSSDPAFNPSQYEGKLDLKSSTLEGGVPAALVGNPSADEYLAELKAKRQGLLDKFANGTLQAANTAVVGTIGNTAGVINGLVDLADNKSFFDNPTFKFMDEWDESVKEAFPLYRSKKEMIGSVGDRVLDKDFLFGDIFQGLGFVGSSLIPGAGWSRAGKVARGAILANRLNRLEQLVAKGAVTTAEYNNLSKFIKTTDDIISTTSNLGAATMGRMYESRLEAKDVYDQTYNSSYDKKLDELRTSGLSDDQAMIQADNYATKKATDARNYSFGANMLLSIPDFYQYTKIFGGIGNKVNTVNKIASKTASETIEQGSKGLLGKATNLLGKAIKNEKLAVAGTEALEEGTQYNIAETAKKLAERDYDFNVSNFVDEFINQSIQNISSPEFLTSSLAGAVIGGGLGFIGNNNNTDNPNLKNSIQAVQENSDLLKSTEKARDGFSKFTQLEQNKTELAEKIANKDTKEEDKVRAEVSHRQLDNLSFAQSVKQNVESGKLDNYLMELETIGNNTKEQITSDFGTTSFEYKSNGDELSPKEVIDKKIQRAKRQAAVYQDIQTKFNNLSQVSKDELYNLQVTTDYNREKLGVVTGMIDRLTLEKQNSELSKIPFTAEKQSDLNNLNKEKEYLIEDQKKIDERFLDIKSGKAEDRKLKTDNLPTPSIPKVKQEQVETPIETIKASKEGKYKGSNIEVLSKTPIGDRITFRVEGNNSKISLSEEEFNKQVLSKGSDTNYNTGDTVILSDGKNVIDTSKLSNNRKELGTVSFFNSPIEFKSNTILDRKNEILSDPNWKSKFRIKVTDFYAKNKPLATKAYSNSEVHTYTNGGDNAIDIILEYNDTIDDKDNWVTYGSLPYSGMIRDSKGKPYDLSTMNYSDFVSKFYIAKIIDSNGVEQTIEYTPDQFSQLKIEQSKFNEFEELLKQQFNKNNKEEAILPTNVVDTRISYFVNSVDTLLNNILTNPEFTNSKLLVISDGKINKDLTNTDRRLAIPDYLTETYGTNNKTFINVELPNGVSFWTIAYVKGNNKKLESEIIADLIGLITNYSKISVNPENDNKVNNIIKDINSKLFISNSLSSYLSFRAYPLEDKTGYKIKVQLKTDAGTKYIDIFNPEITVKSDGTSLTINDLNSYFSFDNLSTLINSGFSKLGSPININAENFISNNTKGNPKLEDLTVPIGSLNYNIKLEYNSNNLPTLTSSETLDKSTNKDLDNEVENDVADLVAKSKEKKKTKFSLEYNSIDNTKVSRQYLENIATKINSQYNLNVSIEPVFDNSGRPVKGKFENGTVYLNPQFATEDTPIHEVIHPFISIIEDKNPLLYKNLIKEMKASSIGKRVLQSVTDNYSDLTDTELEQEALVSLIGYYASGVIPNEERDLISVIKALFKKIASYIKSIFNRDIDPSDIATTTTISDLSDIIVNSNIDLGTVITRDSKEAKLDLLSANDSNKLINTVGAKTVLRIDTRPTKENLKPIINSIIEQTKLENNTRNIDASNIEDLEERKAYKLKRHLVYEALNIQDNVDSIIKSVTEDILKMHYSEEGTYSEEDDTVQNVNDEADIRDYEEGVENSGGWNNVDPEVRNFIYYNTYTYIDEAGYEITEAIDGVNVYKTIQSSLADKDPSEFISILEVISKYDLQLKSVLDNFKVKTGYGIEGTKTLSQSNFYNKFFKAFENSKLEYVQVFESKKGDLIVNSANKSMTAGRLFSRWKNNFIVNKDTLKVNSDKLNKIINDIGSEVISSPIDIVNSLYTGLNNIGIGVSKPFIEYSFISESPLSTFEKEGVIKLDINTIKRLLTSIKKDIDIFDKGEKGSTGLLYEIAEADAIFRTDAIEDTYRDSRGKLRNSFTKQNLITKAISTWKRNIQDSDFIRSIKGDKNNYYHYNYLFNNKLFDSEAQLKEVFKNADLALIGDIRSGKDKYTTRNIVTDAFSKMQIALFRNATSPKDISDNSSFKFDPRTDSRQKFAFVDFGKISDKNTEIALRLPIDNRFFDGKEFTSWYIDQLYDTIFLQEYNKLKNYETKGRLYYSKDKPLTLNPNVIKNNKLGNGWMNLSVLNNSVIDQFSTTNNKPEYLELKDLLKVEDLSTKKELVKKYLNETFTKSFKDYLNILLSEGSINKDSDLVELGNMYANNYILRTSFQQLVKGDLAVSKDLDDDLKRNGRVTAYGDSGIDFTGDKTNTYKVLYMTEAINYKIKEDNNFRDLTPEENKLREEGKEVKGLIEINSDDAGVRMTVKHFIDTLQRLGRLDDNTLKILTKLDNGEHLTPGEINKIDLIPLKGVHGGLDKYFKMSQLCLTKELTSVKDKDGNWIPRLGREQLHNMRELMERNNIGLAMPKSASKSISKSLFNQKQLFESSDFDITEHSEDVSWEDWRLQVENQSGKIEISQPVQILQMIDGSSKISQDIKDKLQTLYEQQREADINDAMNIATGNTVFGKQALVDKFYDNAISSAADANTLEYLSGNEGEFKYNPNLPHIAFTFENYYTSHFNKGVLAQKVAGYKCTLAPSTGIKVLRNTQTGDIVRSDAYEANKTEFKGKEYQVSELRIHSGISPYAECLMTKSQAQKLGLVIGDSIDQEVFKMVGTRLPCQGYSSMIPIKIVDFLPEYYGSTIIAPEEIVYIAGSDYDVDSLFIMRKEAYLDKEGNTRYYTYNESNNDLRWNDYYNYLTTANKNVVSKIRQGMPVEEALKAYNYSSTKEEFLAKEKETGKFFNSKYSVTNEIVNIYEQILTDPKMLPDLQEPVTTSGFDIIGKAIYFGLFNEGSKMNYFHNSDKALKKHFELATQGKRDVGPAALGSSISSFFKKHKVTLNEGDEKRNIPSWHFMFNNKLVNNFYEDDVIDFDFVYKDGKPVLNEEGMPLTTDIATVSKQEVHSGLISITVDNQKDPVCFMLNLDETNTAIASTMIHLGIGGKGFIATLMNSGPVKYGIGNPFEGNRNQVTKESLVKSMMGKASEKEENDIAALYKHLSNISSSTFKVSTLLATNKGIGSTFDDLDRIYNAFNALKNPLNNAFGNIFKAIKENKNLSFNLNSIDKIDTEVLSKVFLSRSGFMTNLRELFTPSLKKNDINLDKDFSGFLISNILKHNRNTDLFAATELALPNNQSSIVSKYYNLLKQYPEFKNNILVKFLTTERGDNVKPDLLYFNQSIKLNGKSLENLTDGYRELLQSDNEEISSFAKDMFYYLLVKDNMKFTVNSFGRLVAPEVFEQLSNELKVAVEGIMEQDDTKLKSITGKSFNTLRNEFIDTYTRWIGNIDKFENYHPKILKGMGLSTTRTENKELILGVKDESKFTKSKFFMNGFPEFLRSDSSMYRLIENNDYSAKYAYKSPIGLSIISPYHLDLETNKTLFNHRNELLNTPKTDNQDVDFTPNVNMRTSIVGDSEAVKPEEYIDDTTIDDQPIIITDNTEPNYKYSLDQPINILESNVLTKPSDKLEGSINEALEQNITKYFENFYYNLSNEDKSRLANKGVPRLSSPGDIIKDFNKVKSAYNNDYNKYLEYIRNCRL